MGSHLPEPLGGGVAGGPGFSAQFSGSNNKWAKVVPTIYHYVSGGMVGGLYCYILLLGCLQCFALHHDLRSSSIC